MEKQYRLKRVFSKKILLLLISLCLIITGIEIHANGSIIVSAQENTWDVTLHIQETSGKKATLVLGASPNASDAQDDLDRPEPPAPPEISYVRAWFTTSLPVPFNRLLQEYKYISSEQMEWNFSILWVSEQENTSSTTITISWNQTQVQQSSFNSFQLYENNSVVADMLTTSFYSFSSDGALHRFNIQAHSISHNDSSGQNEVPILPITLGVIFLIIIAMSVLFWYKRKR